MKLKVSLNTQYLIKGKLLSENIIYRATKKRLQNLYNLNMIIIQNHYTKYKVSKIKNIALIQLTSTQYK